MTAGLLGAAAVIGATGVALGAFGAHALKARLHAADSVSTWDTAVQYHLIHGVALLVLAAWSRLAATESYASALTTTGWLFVAGVVLFSGSLYCLALGGPRWLGPVTPLGGTALIIGWLWLLKPAMAHVN